MEFEELQAIWDTQNDKPAFAMQDPRLLVALYQQRERSRRRVFKRQFASMYVAALVLVAILGAVFATFLNVARLMRRYGSGFPHNGVGMSAWDYFGFAVAAGALLAIVAPMYRERRKHERAQEIFAPSLREELDRGIAQLDFEMGLDRAPRVLRILSLMLTAVMIMSWEAGRSAGDPTPWGQTLVVPFLLFLGGWAGFAASKRRMVGSLARRRALASMRAALDEEIRKDNE